MNEQSFFLPCTREFAFVAQLPFKQNMFNDSPLSKKQLSLRNIWEDPVRQTKKAPSPSPRRTAAINYSLALAGIFACDRLFSDNYLITPTCFIKSARHYRLRLRNMRGDALRDEARLPRRPRLATDGVTADNHRMAVVVSAPKGSGYWNGRCFHIRW